MKRRCAEDPEQPLCKFRSQVTVYEMDAREATGPVYARHIGPKAAPPWKRSPFKSRKKKK